MLLSHRSCGLGSQPQPAVAAQGPQAPVCRRPRRHEVQRRTFAAAAAAREEDGMVNLCHERDATATASTSGHQQTRRLHGSSTRPAAAITPSPTPSLHVLLPPRDVRAHVAAHMPSTQQPSGQQQHMPLILSTRAMTTAPQADLPPAQEPAHTPAASPDTPQGPAAGRFQDLALYEEIKACDTWQDVLEVIADEAPAISLHTASQAASRLLLTVRMSPHGLPRATALMQAQPAFQTLLGVLSEGVPRMTRAQLCNTLHALAQLKVPLDEPTLAAYAQRTQQLAPELNARDVSQVLHGWSTLKRSPGVQALDLVGFRAKVLLEEGEFEPQSLSMMLTSLAALDYRNHMLLRAAASVATLRMVEFTPQGVANVSYSLAKLGHLSPACLAAAAGAYSQAPEQYKTQEVCNLLWSMAHHRWHPQEVLSVMVRSLVKRSSLLRPADFTQLFGALGTFGVHPGNQMLSELLGQLPRQLQRFNATELCSVFWGLGLIGETRHPVFSQIAGLLPDHFEAGRLNEGLLRQCFQAFLCGKLEDVLDADSDKPAKRGAGAAAAAVSFPPLMMEAMKRAWRVSTLANTVAQEAAAGQGAEAGVAAEREGVQGAAVPAAEGSPAAGAPARPSRPQQSIKSEVASIVKSLRVPHELGRPTKDGLVMIDVAIKAGEERFVAMQVVMEHEHTCNTGQFLGPLQFQTQVLEMNGWEVRHVRAKDLKSLDHATKPLFIADLLRSMGVRVAGGGAKTGAPAAGGRGAGAGAAARGAGKPASGLEMLMEDEGGARGGKRKAQ